MTEVTIRAADGGSFMGYLGLPSAGKGPGVVVIQEIFGVNAVMRAITDGLAGQGYVALCPDLFWRQQPGIQITDKTEAEWARAFELYKGFNEAKGVDDLKSTIAHLRADKRCTGKIGTVGFCLGGKLAYLMATRTDVDCSVGYYGVGIQDALDEAKNLKHALLLHIAGRDEFVPPPAQEKIHAGLKGNAHVTMYDYPNCGHAFARPGGAHWDQAAADQAGKRSLEFFHRHLGA